MAYLKALMMVSDGYREVTIRDDKDKVEAKVIRKANGALSVWTPTPCTAPDKHESECRCNARSIRKYVGSLMPDLNAMLGVPA